MLCWRMYDLFYLVQTELWFNWSLKGLVLKQLSVPQWKLILSRGRYSLFRHSVDNQNLAWGTRNLYIEEQENCWIFYVIKVVNFMAFYIIHNQMTSRYNLRAQLVFKDVSLHIRHIIPCAVCELSYVST